jgi:serine/threonine protein kinase
MPFLVMDYAPNGTLRQRYPSGTILTSAGILHSVQLVAQALQYTHTHKKIHRDVKPENMLLDASNDVLLSDFGIATIAHTTGNASIQDQAGTIPYMAPEQIQGKPCLASAQYALGIVIYEWLTRTRPFTGTSWEILSQHLAAAPPPLHERIPTISPAIERVVERALAKDPHQRFERMEAFAQAFADAVEQAYMSQTYTAPAQVRFTAPPNTPKGKATPVQQEESDLKKAKEQWLEQGHTHYYAGDYQKAIAAYDQAIADSTRLSCSSPTTLLPIATAVLHTRYSRSAS